MSAPLPKKLLVLESVKRLLQKSQETSLATLKDGQPFVTATGFIVDENETNEVSTPILLLSDLAQHTRNIKIEGERSHGIPYLLVPFAKPHFI